MLFEAESLKEKGMEIGEEDERNVADLLIDQVEFCNVIVVTKTDLLDQQSTDNLMGTLRRLNPKAEVVIADQGRVTPAVILGTGKFSMDEAANAPGWLAELRGEHIPETEEYGIGSFVYEARLPFHPQRLYNFLAAGWQHGNLVRSKGFFWLASRFDQAGEWSQAGGIMNHGFAGMFWAAIPADQWPDNPEHRASIDTKFEAPYGDRRQEIVFIGQDLDADGARKGLDACLLSEEELAAGPQLWLTLPDPFPQWIQYADQTEEEFA